MILVDIYVPSLDKTYDFQVDEKAKVTNVTAEIVEMIGNETRSVKGLSGQDFLLCSMDLEQILSGSSSLQEYGIRNGSKLILV